MEETETKTFRAASVDQELKKCLEALLPDVSTWSVLKCARYLKAGRRTLWTADVDKLREQVLEAVRAHARESLLSVDEVTTYHLCIPWFFLTHFFELDWSEDSRSWVGGRYRFEEDFALTHTLGGYTYGGISYSPHRRISAEKAKRIAHLFDIWPETV